MGSQGCGQEQKQQKCKWMNKFKRLCQRRLDTIRVVRQEGFKGEEQGEAEGRKGEGKSLTRFQLKTFFKGYVSSDNYNVKFQNTVRNKMHGIQSTYIENVRLKSTWKSVLTSAHCTERAMTFIRMSLVKDSCCSL